VPAGDPLWPQESQLLELIASRIGAAVTTQVRGKSPGSSCCTALGCLVLHTARYFSGARVKSVGSWSRFVTCTAAGSSAGARSWDCSSTQT
jgi:hypothetical protein